MGLRTAFRKLAKPVVMTLVAGSLALSLTVSTTQQAEATAGVAVAPVIAAAEGVLAGGVRLALPSLLSIAIATTPVGWFIGGGLAIGALAVGAYATRDYWVPWVQDTIGSWGKPDTDKDVDKVQYKVLPGFRMTGHSESGDTVTMNMAYTGNASRSAYVTTSFSCKQTTYVSGKPAVGSVFNKAFTWSTSVSPGRTWALTGSMCGTGATVQGGVMGPSTVQADGPENQLTFGTSAPSGFDPKGADVKYKTTAECIDEGGNKTSITAEFFGDEGGAKIPSCAAAGKGHGTGKISVDGYAPTAPGVPGTIAETIWDAQAPPVDENHPLCGPTRPGPGCSMAITVDGKPCTVGAWDCENWTEIWKDPNTAPRVGCTYGPYTLAVDLCRVMEPAYRPGGGPATEENMDGNPQTRNYTNPGGTTYAPPSTGTGTVPGLGGQPGPGSTPEEAGCFPTGWAALNPIEWVMKPVGCALSAAFVPKPEVVQAQQTRIQTKFQNVGFARVTGAWLATFESVGGGSGCAGPTVNFSMQGVSQSLQPFNACSAPMSTVAGITYAVSAIGIVLFGGLGMIRAVGSAFGFNFTLGKGASE